MKFGVGQAVPRKEDPRLLKGAGRYVDDVTLARQAYAHIRRSDIAHGRITAVDAGAARAAPGVLAVYLHGNKDVAHLNPLKTGMPVKNADGSAGHYPALPHLADGVVRYVGQPIALVVAETALAARNAAELIEIDYDDLPVVTGAEAALADDAPTLHEGGNRAYDWAVGDSAAVEAAFATAPRVTKLRIVNPRIVVNAMEPRAVNAEFDAETGRWTVWCATQGTHSMRRQIAGALGVEPDKLRVLTPDVGGGFGMKLMLHPEYALACAAAKAVGRPVKWTADRSESFLADLQGRDIVTEAEAATDKAGRILAMRLESWSNLGAYPSVAGPACHTDFCGDLAPTVYDIPAVYNRVHGAYTNTTPTDAYRGAGRPEQNYIMERLIDRVAADCGVSQADIRRRNLAGPERMPYTTALGVTFDSGDFPAVLEKAIEAADVEGFEARRQEAASRGKAAGLGVISYMERTGGGPVEEARIQLLPETGKVRIWAGTQSTGQGHETAFAQIVHERLGIDYDCIEWAGGDSDGLPGGGGTGGSRSLIMAGKGFLAASDDTIEKARIGAADALEAAEADIEFRVAEGGRFTVAGTDRSVSIFEAAAKVPSQPDDPSQGMTGEGHVNERSASFPNGCHIAEVEIDPETGHLDLTRYTVVDDFGVVLNPLLVKGQVMGGIAQGIGEALCEEAIYDPETGQPITGSYMDYQMPRAGDVPSMKIAFAPTVCQNNEMGVKGCGEAGTVAAAPVIVNAALDALRPFGVSDLQMPLTPRRVWRALAEARAAKAAE